MAHYPFDGDTLDVSGYGNHATPHGDSILTTDRFGVADRAQEFDWTHYLTADDSDSLDAADPLSIATWVRWDTISTTYSPFVGKNYSTAYGLGFYEGLSSFCPDPLAIRTVNFIVAGQSTYFTNGPSFECGTGRWYHVAVTFDPATDTAILYVDGELAETKLVVATPGNSSSPLGIGRDGAVGDIFLGALDDLRIYNAVLTADEVRAIASVGFRDDFESGDTNAWSFSQP